MKHNITSLNNVKSAKPIFPNRLKNKTQKIKLNKVPIFGVFYQPE
jgi:hypothetical protein